LLVDAQGGLRDLGNRRLSTGGGSGDSLKRRDRFEDSITIQFRYLDSSAVYKMDSSINDFSTRFPILPEYHYLGNPGTAAKSIIFQPQKTIGWDPGFHTLDLYKWSLPTTAFFTSTRPYTEIGYLLGSQTQQIIEVLHTQNYRPNLNVALKYRLINSPGFFKNQRTNHNNYLFSSWYQSKKKRYNNFLVFLGNKLQSEENGGIKTDKEYLNDPVYDDRFGVPTQLGLNKDFTRDFFNTQLQTGTRHRLFNILLRQQYDFGKKDSIVTDTTIIPLFYPRLRFEHTLRYGKYRYQFRDYAATDSQYYNDYYDIVFPFRGRTDSILFTDNWTEWSNDFSIYQYPDARNLQQFIKAGIEYQLINGSVKRESLNLFNIIGHGEYRNLTRNKKWDLQAFGRLHFTGYNAGDYHAYISLQRLLSKKIGSLQAGFENINRSPSFNFDERSSFYLDVPKSFAKENITHLFTQFNNPLLRMEIGVHYYLLANYLYYDNFYKMNQEDDLFNVLRIQASKTFRLNKRINWYSELTAQQKTGNVALNFPLFFTRNRILYEGNFGFRNLRIAFGTEFRYHTPYKADHYSPLIGQFTFQDTLQIKNRPDIHALVNFRIRSFKAYVRFENLNTLRIEDGLEFKRHNFAAPQYPYPGLVTRLGIYWSFVN
jgi:hypothetical protein